MNQRRSRFLEAFLVTGALTLGLSWATPGRSESPPESARPACEHRNPDRSAFFGDLHVHTRMSLDAVAFGTRSTPRDAYRFARGQSVAIPPYDRDGFTNRRLQIDRPLDFAAVTDHAEFFGEVQICETPGSPGYDSPACVIYRRLPKLAHYIAGQRGVYLESPDRYRFCGPENRICLEASRSTWQTIVEAAEEANDRTASCEFTSFVGYEWTGSPKGDNLHRNVIFATGTVPGIPLSYIEAPKISELWAWLRADCIEGLPGCDALAIPHNSNLSAGLMFRPTNPDGSPMTEAFARDWAAMEPLVEIVQHKGESECQLGVGTEDELCNFEQLRYANLTGFSLMSDQDPAPRSYVRNVLKEGLLQEAKLGANPFRFGFIGSTDTHFGIPGAVHEKIFAGHMFPGHTPESLPERITFNPGGLAAFWAEENTRESLFAAMKRREAFATSGPRIRVRLFGSWEIEANVCERSAFARAGYRQGVPMGSLLPPIPERSDAYTLHPSFAVRALKDPGTEALPGTDLQRVQIVKGWLQDGQARERVYEIAGAPDNGASVDLDTCEPIGDGFDSLCSRWTDPDFDSRQPAFYYARVVENPTCRWSTWACNAHGVDCSSPEDVPAGLADCCNESYPKTLQERAWTSPIWYVPGEP